MMKLKRCGGLLLWLFHLMSSVMSGISTGPETVLFSCDFETDFCDMVQLTYGDFNWTRHSGPTPTPDTGPSSAYGGSYYMYMEATDHLFQDAGIAISSLEYQGIVCMSFAYHMYGAHTESLFTRTKQRNGPGWYKYGDQGNHWREAVAEFDLPAGDSLDFQGSVGTDTKGDIAVDDVIVRTGSCKRQVDLPYFCSFESGFCGMTQTNDDNFDWMREDRQTGSSDTGPSQAYDGSWFLYIDTSDQRLGNGFWAGMETPAFSHTGPVCVRFHYHMFGTQDRTLIAKLQNNETVRRIFEAGIQGNQWFSAEITVADFQQGNWILFDGRRGYSPSGDIAIDQVFISTDECNACQVNNGDCQHTCHKTTQGGRICTCDDGFQLSGDSDTACIDIDECAINNGNCSHNCSNTHGTFACHCDSGYTVAPDGRNCTDCRAAYQRKLEASQAFASVCPTIRLLLDVTLESCLLEACKDNVSVVAFLNAACALKDCIGNDIQLASAAGNTGWDIYVQNVTWPQGFPGSLGDVDSSGKFPMWQLLVGVILGTVGLVAVGVGVALHLRRKRTSHSAVHYENDAVHVSADRQQPLDCKEGEEQNTETGVYSEIRDPTYEQMVPKAGSGAVYQNSAVQGEELYQGLNPVA